MATTTRTREELARDIMDQLPEFSAYAAADARVWTGYGKCRIYLGRKYLEIIDGDTVDVGSNPYSVSALLSDMGVTVR